MINEKVSFLSRVHQSLAKTRKINPWYAALVIVFLLFLLLYSGLSKNENTLQQSAGVPQLSQKVDLSPTSTLTSISEPTLVPSTQPTATPKPTNTPTPTPINTPTPSPTPTPITFNSNRGNNYVAVEFAQGFMDTMNNAVEGSVKDVYLALSPEDIGDKDEETYKQSVVSAFMTVEMDNLLWNIWDDDMRKDVVASMVIAVGNSFGGYPHIYVNNGVRTVAVGEYDWLKTEPKITLK